ncbi:MAG TPA: ABC transporter ATP-binding protein, partial [Rhabdochlamydiaceae bacterium]
MYSSLSRFIWHFAKPYRLYVAGLFCIGLLWAAYFSLNPTMVKLIIDAVSEHPTDLLQHVLGPILGFLGMALTLVGLSTAYDYLILKFTPRFKAGIIEETHAYLQQHSYNFFQTNLAGSLSNKISDLSKGAAAIITSIIDDFFSRTLLFVFGLTTLFWVHPLFAFAMIAWSILFFTLSFFLARKSEKYSVDYSEARSTVMGKVVDAISNIFNIKLFGTRKYEHGYLRKHLGEMIGKEQRLHWYMLKLKLVQSISITFLLVAMVGILIYTRMQGLITVGDFALVLTLSTAIVDETFYLALQFVSFTEDVGVCKQALSILSKQPEALDAPGAASLQVPKGEIVFENVSFNYVNGRPVYENLNLAISSGEKVGLVGLSGSGKST